MATPGGSPAETWPLWEVFVRANRGLSHVHVGRSTHPTPSSPSATPATCTPVAVRACRCGSSPRMP